MKGISFIPDNLFIWTLHNYLYKIENSFKWSKSFGRIFSYSKSKMIMSLKKKVHGQCILPSAEQNLEPDKSMLKARFTQRAY